MIRSLVLPLMMASVVLTACQPDAEAHGTHGTLSPRERQTCLAQGGRPAQGLGDEICAMPTDDAHRACTHGDQCSAGLCLEQDDGRGACAPYDMMFGCFPLLLGAERATICMD